MKYTYCCSRSLRCPSMFVHFTLSANAFCLYAFKSEITILRREYLLKKKQEERHGGGGAEGWVGVVLLGEYRGKEN